MKNIAFLSLLVSVSSNLTGMERPNLIDHLRNTPAGESFILHGCPWKVEENSLFLNAGTGKVVLLNNDKACGKTVCEHRFTIEIRPSQADQNRLSLTSSRSSKVTKWGILMASSWLAAAGALLGFTLSYN